VRNDQPFLVCHRNANSQQELSLLDKRLDQTLGPQLLQQVEHLTRANVGIYFVFGD
jgi:hypothetical protein